MITSRWQIEIIYYYRTQNKSM